VAKKSLKKGIFITFEGPEGCGKSTHSALIAASLKSEGFDVVLTREPGGTAVGKKIRAILLDSKKIGISPLTETLLFEASRSQLVKEVIKPALKKKKIVISDRFSDATFVYQGYAGGTPLADIAGIEAISSGGLTPDMTILLDIEAQRGLAKISVRQRDRIESKPLIFHKRVRNGYLKLAGRNAKRIKIVKVQKSIEKTFEKIAKEVANGVCRYRRTG
jgi:dTMP kinase